MIAYLEGTVQKMLPDTIIINTGGVGYAVFINQLTATEIQENSDIELFIHTVVREDSITLFGFLKIEELNLFKLLLSVSGVGPKTALEIMNNPVASIKYSISNGDASLLANTKGIGKKTAERIIIDLKEKIGVHEKPAEYKSIKEFDEDVMNALINLGYHKQVVQRTLKKMPEEITETEAIIRYFLQNI